MAVKFKIGYARRTSAETWSSEIVTLTAGATLTIFIPALAAEVVGFCVHHCLLWQQFKVPVSSVASLVPLLCLSTWNRIPLDEYGYQSFVSRRIKLLFMIDIGSFVCICWWGTTAETTFTPNQPHHLVSSMQGACVSHEHNSLNFHGSFLHQVTILFLNSLQQLK